MGLKACQQSCPNAANALKLGTYFKLCACHVREGEQTGRTGTGRFGHVFKDVGFDTAGFERLQTTTGWLRADHRANPVPSPRPPMAAADLRLAELRSVPEISRVAALPGLLGREARRAAALGDGRPLPADQAGRAQGDRRRVQAELIFVIVAVVATAAPRSERGRGIGVE